MNGTNMEWGDLRVFLAIAREGTLGAAARKLGQSQPTMGRRLVALERAMGHTLFQRTKDGFVLTDEGTGLAHSQGSSWRNGTASWYSQSRASQGCRGRAQCTGNAGMCIWLHRSIEDATAPDEHVAHTNR